MKLGESDRKLIWHPFTQEKLAPLPIVVTHGDGAYLYDETGKKYLDLVSSWWVNLHGHAHPKIAHAIYEQALKLEHVMFAAFTHQPAVELAEKLKDMLPSKLNRFFYADNGSTSIEVALKMAYQYHLNLGEKKRSIFLSFDGGYHGDTFGAMSVSRESGFHDHFKKLFFSTLSVPYPSTWEGDEDIDQKEEEALKQLREILELKGSEIAAFILEPLVQGSSGMRIVRGKFLEQAIELARSYDILIIFDEVMTGFGRLGTNFALDQLNVVPDFLCLSKGLSGGFLPLALTITSEKIYQAFLGDDLSNAFLHGHSYTANPLACTAAIASLELLIRQETQNAITAIKEQHQESLIELAQNKKFRHIRHIGTIAAFELTGESSFDRTVALRQKFLDAGLLLRPLGNTIYIIPPYCTAQQEIKEAYEIIEKII